MSIKICLIYNGQESELDCEYFLTESYDNFSQFIREQINELDPLTNLKITAINTSIPYIQLDDKNISTILHEDLNEGEIIKIFVTKDLKMDEFQPGSMEDVLCGFKNLSPSGEEDFDDNDYNFYNNKNIDEENNEEEVNIRNETKNKNKEQKEEEEIQNTLFSSMGKNNDNNNNEEDNLEMNLNLNLETKKIKEEENIESNININSINSSNPNNENNKNQNSKMNNQLSKLNDKDKNNDKGINNISLNTINNKIDPNNPNQSSTETNTNNYNNNDFISKHLPSTFPPLPLEFPPDFEGGGDFKSETCSICGNIIFSQVKFICSICDSCTICEKCEDLHPHPCFKFKTSFLSNLSDTYKFIDKFFSFKIPINSKKITKLIRKEYDLKIVPVTDLCFGLRPNRIVDIPVKILNLSDEEVNSSQFIVIIKNNKLINISYRTDKIFKLLPKEEKVLKLLCRTPFQKCKEKINVEIYSAELNIRMSSRLNFDFEINVNEDQNEEQLNKELTQEIKKFYELNQINELSDINDENNYTNINKNKINIQEFDEIENALFFTKEHKKIVINTLKDKKLRELVEKLKERKERGSIGGSVRDSIGNNKDAENISFGEVFQMIKKFNWNGKKAIEALIKEKKC